MNWFVLALACAFLTACCDAVSKRIMWDNDEWLTGTVVLGISSLILLPIFFSLELKPVTTELVVLLGICLPLEIFAYYLFLSSIRMAALSLTVPLLAFTPALTIITSAILVGEQINAVGAVGISLVTVGAYLLNGDLINLNLLAPIKAIFTNPRIAADAVSGFCLVRHQRAREKGGAALWSASVRAADTLRRPDHLHSDYHFEGKDGPD